MAEDTHKVRWQVVHDADDVDPREFVSLTKALRFVRDEADFSTSENIFLITDDMTVATFSAHTDGVQIGEDAISLVLDAWNSLDDD